jgi:hypothetical protein
MPVLHPAPDKIACRLRDVSPRQNVHRGVLIFGAQGFDNARRHGQIVWTFESILI